MRPHNASFSSWQSPIERKSTYSHLKESFPITFLFSFLFSKSYQLWHIRMLTLHCFYCPACIRIQEKLTAFDDTNLGFLLYFVLPPMWYLIFLFLSSICNSCSWERSQTLTYWRYCLKLPKMYNLVLTSETDPLTISSCVVSMSCEHQDLLRYACAVVKATSYLLSVTYVKLVTKKKKKIICSYQQL